MLMKERAFEVELSRQEWVGVQFRRIVGQEGEAGLLDRFTSLG